MLPRSVKVAGWEVSLLALEGAARAERGGCSQGELGDEGYKAEKYKNWWDNVGHRIPPHLATL